MRNQNNYYARLNGKTVEIIDGSIPEALAEWSEQFEKGDARRVGSDIVNGITVSTVFLGINYGWGDKALWFETMVFGGDSMVDEYCERYTTYDEALAGHTRVVEKLRKGEPLEEPAT